MTNREDISAFVTKSHSDGLTIVETIKAVRELFSIGLGEAKDVVVAQPCWRLTVESSMPLHEEAIQEVVNSSDLSRSKNKT